MKWFVIANYIWLIIYYVWISIIALISKSSYKKLRIYEVHCFSSYNGKLKSLNTDNHKHYTLVSSAIINTSYTLFSVFVRWSCYTVYRMHVTYTPKFHLMNSYRQLLNFLLNNNVHNKWWTFIKTICKSNIFIHGTLKTICIWIFSIDTYYGKVLYG